MARDPIPTWCFSVIVVKKGRRFLVVHERKHGQLWYLPAGRVEPGESFFEAAHRETLEEAGIPIIIEGVLRVEHSPGDQGSRMRVIFLARPKDDTPPKSTPDEESLEARWVSLEELAELPQRSPYVPQLFEDVLNGAQVFPCSLLQREGERLLPR